MTPPWNREGRGKRLSRQRKRRVLLTLATALAVGLLSAALRATYLVEAVELETLDARFRLLRVAADADTGIVIVDVDNLSLDLARNTLGRWPWPREVWALVIDYLAAGGASAIAFDFTFPEPDLSDPAGDSLFAAASARAGTVVQTLSFQRITDSMQVLAQFREDSTAVALLGARFNRTADVPPGTDYQTVQHPYPQLLASARSAGSINHEPDAVDGTTRRVPLLYRFRGGVYPTFGLAAASTADTSRFGGCAQWQLQPHALALCGVTVPVDRNGAMLLNWKGPYRDTDTRRETYRVFPVAQVFKSYEQVSTGQTPELPLETFRGKLVLIGASGSGLFEARATPFSPADPGVMIHATVADNLRNGNALRRAPLVWNLLAVLAAALLAGLGVALAESALLGALVAIVLASLQLGLAAWLFAVRDIWINAAPPTLAILLTFTGGMAVNYMTEGREKRKIKEMFSKYVAPEYVAQLAEDPSRLRLEGQRAELSILFSDIRGFTTISEQMEPPEVVLFLNDFLDVMATIVKDTGGTLDKFIGDAVMAFWGEPIQHADHARRACDCALAMRDATLAIAERFAREGKPPIRIGIGVNTADVVVGNIGSLQHKLDYTVIGDGVNLASRLEGLNKDFSTTIIISEFTRARLAGGFETRPLGAVNVKGKNEPVQIFELLGKSRVRSAFGCVLLLTSALPAAAQKLQWSDAVYVPGRWQAGKLGPAAGQDTLALVMRIDYFASAPRWRAELRRTANGTDFGEPAILLGDKQKVVVATALGTTPLEQHALGRDTLVRAALVFDAAGKRTGAANGAIVERKASGDILRVSFRKSARTATFTDENLNPKNATSGRQIISNSLVAVGNQRSAAVVATAGARGVDKVKTPKGEVAVKPDSAAVRRMESRSVNEMKLEEFLRAGGLGAYRVTGTEP